MAMTFEQAKELEEIKQDHRVKLLALQQKTHAQDHAWEMERLEMQLKIATTQK